MEETTILKGIPLEYLETSKITHTVNRQTIITLEKVLNALGVSCYCVSYLASYTLDIFDFKLNDYKGLYRLSNSLQALSIAIKRKVSLASESSEDFSLLVETPKREIIKLGDCNPYGVAGVADIGKTIERKRAFIDFFNESPHTLIAGATGAGKSVLLNALLCSLLCSTSPKDRHFTIIDPKRVEFSLYKPLEKEKYYCQGFDGYKPCQVNIITDIQEGINELKRACEVVENRYKLLEKYQVRNIYEFKKKEPNTVFRHEFLIIDELADFMLTSRYEVESYAVRIAQLGRACGVHLILATQRPSVNVVTGLIKANITTRVALTCASFRDSVTILDHKGAESLLGKGDGLLKLPNKFSPIRFQSAYASDEEINKVVQWWSNQ